MKKKNIVFFMMDQLSAKWVEAMDLQPHKLQNFKRLQQMGTTFTQTYSNNPVCCPARASIATGLTTRGHGVLENGYNLNPNLNTFMKTLQKGGWTTAVFGKTHFTSHYMGSSMKVTEYGFDVEHRTEDIRAGEWLDWIEEKHPEYYDFIVGSVWHIDNEEFRCYGKNKINLLERQEKNRHLLQEYIDTVPGAYGNAYPLPYPKELTQTAWITQNALEFLAGREHDQPFFAQISYVSPHSPYIPPAEYLELIDEDCIPQPVPAEWYQKEDAPAYFKDKTPSSDDWKYARKCYFADLLFLDEQLGKVLDGLEEHGLLDDTYIVLLADHGDMLADHGFYLKEEHHYDACIRIPLVIAGPGVQKGKTADDLVSLMDIYPTVLDMAGLQNPPLYRIPGHGDPSRDNWTYGESILPLCTGEGSLDRDHVYIESYNAIWSNKLGEWAKTIRTHQYRYTYYPDGNGEQLFDLIADPDELHNLADLPEYSSVKDGLRKMMFDEMIRQDYPKTPNNLFSLGVH